MPMIDFTMPEISALDTLCELELGSKEDTRIEAWRHVATAQDKLNALLVDHWAAIPGFPIADWRWDVANDETRLGYHAWASKKQADRGDDETPPTTPA